MWGTPALRSLKGAFPGAAIHFLVNRKWMDLFRGNPNIDHLHGYRHPFLHQILTGLSLRRFSFDKVLIFHANKDIHRLIRMIRPSQVLSHQPFLWIPQKDRLNLNGKMHGIKKNMELIKAVGATENRGGMEIFFEPSVLKDCETFMNDHGLREGEFLYLNIGAALPSKRWPLASFGDLARRLLDNYPFRIVLGGGIKEKEAILRMRASLPRPDDVVVSYDLSLKTDAALIKKSRLLITCDTGPMHIGFAVGTPTVSIFGPTDPAESGPYQLQGQTDNIIQAAKDCETCDWHTCRIPVCMEKVSVDAVMEKALRVLA